MQISELIVKASSIMVIIYNFSMINISIFFTFRELDFHCWKFVATFENSRVKTRWNSPFQAKNIPDERSTDKSTNISDTFASEHTYICRMKSIGIVEWNAVLHANKEFQREKAWTRLMTDEVRRSIVLLSSSVYQFTIPSSGRRRVEYQSSVDAKNAAWIRVGCWDSR